MKETNVDTGDFTIKLHRSHQVLKCALSLRFNQPEFCDGLYLHRKTLGLPVLVLSGAPLESRVALGPAGEPAFGSSGRPTAGFRRLGRRAQLHQKRRNYPVDPHGRKATRPVATLPWQPEVRNMGACQSQLGEGC
jgi:hypothetical protein